MFSAASAQVDVSGRFQQATELNSIDGDGMRPWHLKVTFKRLDGKGATTSTGQAEEWWSSDDAWRLVVTDSERSVVQLSTPQGRFHSASVIDADVHTILQYMIHPFQDRLSADVVAKGYERSIGAVQGTCMMVEPAKEFQPPLAWREFKEAPVGLFPTYCLADGDFLLASHPTASLTLVTTRTGTFLDHHIALAAFLDIGKTKVLEAEVESLKTIDAAEVDLSSSGLTPSTGKAALVAGGVIAGSLAVKVNPFYPEGAKERHASGTVLLRALIGTDGRVRGLRVIAAPDFDLLVSAVNAVSRWRYRPYLLNGEPTEVDTTITVNFNLSPG